MAKEAGGEGYCGDSAEAWVYTMGCMRRKSTRLNGAYVPAEQCCKLEDTYTITQAVLQACLLLRDPTADPDADADADAERSSMRIYPVHAYNHRCIRSDCRPKGQH